MNGFRAARLAEFLSLSYEILLSNGILGRFREMHTQIRMWGEPASSEGGVDGEI